MSTGYVLVDVEPGNEYSVYEQASKLSFVSDAQILFGDHDMILKIIVFTTSNLGGDIRFLWYQVRGCKLP